ncbi:MAG: hypothetical protein KKF65_00100 [Nanoarchaeota archaeon]|nr:hypothetical protein [Nanoarchaeota archaeon]
MVYAFYDFEGVDFAGKTTLAMLLADSIGGEYIHCPMVELTDKQKELINSMSLDDRFNFYINENSRVSKHVETTR